MATPSKFNFEEKVNIYETASSPKPNCIIIKKIANNPDCKTQTRETKKRKNSNEAEKAPGKRKKMNIEEMEEIIKKASTDAVNAASDSIQKKLDEALLPIHSSMNQLINREEERDKRMDCVEDDIKGLKESFSTEKLKETVRSEISSMEDTKCAASHKLYLVGLIEKVSANLLVHGLVHKDPLQAVTDMVSNLNIPDAKTRVRIRNAHSIGKQKEDGTPQSIHMTLGSQVDRNEILKHAKNLPRNVQIEKDIPLAYRARNKKMKRRAWKLRSCMNVQTQITFNNHALTLKYKDTDDRSKAWVIFEEYYPTIQETLNQQGGNSSNVGPPSKTITKSEIEKANRTLIISNMKNQTKAEAEVFIQGILGDKSTFIEEVIPKDKLTLIRCTNQDSVKEVMALCKAGKVGNDPIRCETYND